MTQLVEVRLRRAAFVEAVDAAVRSHRQVAVAARPRLTRPGKRPALSFIAAQANREILAMATSDNAQLLALSGPRNPYAGKLGVLEEGAYADLLLVDGNPMENIGLLANPDTSLMIVIKDGKIYKKILKG